MARKSSKLPKRLRRAARGVTDSPIAQEFIAELGVAAVTALAASQLKPQSTTRKGARRVRRNARRSVERLTYALAEAARGFLRAIERRPA